MSAELHTEGERLLDSQSYYDAAVLGGTTRFAREVEQELAEAVLEARRR